MAKKATEEDEKPPFSMNTVLDSYRVKARAYTDAGAKSKAITWGIIGFLSLVGSGAAKAFPIHPAVDSWLPALIGSPAGIILSLMLLTHAYRKQTDEGFYGLKARKSFKQRLWWLLITATIILSLLFASSRFLEPWGYGVGGAIIITLVILSIAFAVRTPYELELSAEGLPDPRDLAEGEEELYADDSSEGSIQEEEEEEDPPVYYTEDGRLGGKL